MKRCCRCKEEKDLKEFNKDKSAKDGLQKKCKICLKDYRQLNREKINQYQKQYKKRSPEKQRARLKLNYAVKSGRIHKPLYCSSCDRDKYLEAHHTDYSKPFDVTWLCRTCHRELHSRLRDKESTN